MQGYGGKKSAHCSPIYTPIHTQALCMRLLHTWLQILGSPAESELDFISSDKARRYIKSLPCAEPADFMRMWPNANPKV